MQGVFKLIMHHKIKHFVRFLLKWKVNKFIIILNEKLIYFFSKAKDE